MTYQEFKDGFDKNREKYIQFAIDNGNVSREEAEKSVDKTFFSDCLEAKIANGEIDLDTLPTKKD